jgi:hypothetical protein
MLVVAFPPLSAVRQRSFVLVPVRVAHFPAMKARPLPSG